MFIVLPYLIIRIILSVITLVLIVTKVQFLHYNYIIYFRMAQVVKVMLALAIFVTYGLQCYVAVDIAWNEYLGVKFDQSKRQLFWEYFTRTCLVLVTCKYAIFC